MVLSRGQSAIHQISINWTCRTRSVFNSPITYLSEMKQKTLSISQVYFSLVF